MRTWTRIIRNRTGAILLATSLLLPMAALPAAALGPPEDVGSSLEAEWTVSPTSVASGATVDLVFTFTSATAALVAEPGSLVVSVPAAWAPPPHEDDSEPVAPGLVVVENDADAGCNQEPSIDSIDTTDAGFSVTILLKCNIGQSFSLTYADVTAPTVEADTDYPFDATLSGPDGLGTIELPLDVTVTFADDDGDEVSNADDDCPGTPAGEAVDGAGCSESQLDEDGDEVSNADDLCPGTPAGQPVNATGCPLGGGGGGDGGGGGGGGDGGGDGGDGPITPPVDPPITPPQVSRCVDDAPTASFRDVPSGHVHEREIACITWKGITVGTSPRTFSPGQVTTRAQMAGFLARTIREAGVALPPGRDLFSDDQRSVHHHAINQLAAAGIVTGKGGGQFDPGAPVRRDQMATMLANTYAYVRDERSQPQRDHFGDDNGTVHENNINVAADLGLALGRSATAYEPASGTRRAQMASFLTRLLELLGS